MCVTVHKMSFQFRKRKEEKSKIKQTNKNHPNPIIQVAQTSPKSNGSSSSVTPQPQQMPPTQSDGSLRSAKIMPTGIILAGTSQDNNSARGHYLGWSSSMESKQLQQQELQQQPAIIPKQTQPPQHLIEVRIKYLMLQILFPNDPSIFSEGATIAAYTIIHIYYIYMHVVCR